jgi:hypothetical protein
VIKISSFSVVQNLSKWIWEFDNDKMTVKIKSLITEFEREVPYEKIQFIRNNSTADIEWLWVSFLVIVLLGLVRMGFNYFSVVNSTIDIAEKVIVVLALSIDVLVFRKQEYYWFFDADKNLLATIMIDKKNKQLLLDGIGLIRQKNKMLGETYFDDPLPSAKPVFQIEEFDFADSLNKCKNGFYEDKIVIVEKSLIEETTTIIKYDELNGQTKFAKIGNDKWDSILFYWLYFMCITGMFTLVFFAEQLKGNYFYGKLFYVGFALLVPLFLLKYIKSEILFFHDKKDNGIFWVMAHAKNREKLNQIIEFVHEKVGLQR